MFKWLRRVLGRRHGRGAEERKAPYVEPLRWLDEEPEPAQPSPPPEPERTLLIPPAVVLPPPQIAQPMPPPWLRGLPKRVMAVDVETTGLHSADRIVSFAGVLLETAPLAEGRYAIEYTHLLFDPGKKSHPRAEAVHGYSDWILRHQDPFADHAGSIIGMMDSADLIIAHNAEFDMRFIDNELSASVGRTPRCPVHCTMVEYRTLGLGRASLTAAAQTIGLARIGRHHGALEDALLAMSIYLWMRKVPMPPLTIGSIPNPSPTNMKPVPPLPDGPLPRRKRRAKASPPQ